MSCEETRKRQEILAMIGQKFAKRNTERDIQAERLARKEELNNAASYIREEVLKQYPIEVRERLTREAEQRRQTLLLEKNIGKIGDSEYFCVPRGEILYNRELKPKEKLVYCVYLVTYNVKEGYAYPPLTKIEGWTGLSVRTIQRLNETLQEKGYLTIEKERQFGARLGNNHYIPEHMLMPKQDAGNAEVPRLRRYLAVNNTLTKTTMER